MVMLIVIFVERHPDHEVIVDAVAGDRGRAAADGGGLEENFL